MPSKKATKSDPSGASRATLLRMLSGIPGFRPVSIALLTRPAAPFTASDKSSILDLGSGAGSRPSYTNGWGGMSSAMANSGSIAANRSDRNSFLSWDDCSGPTGLVCFLEDSFCDRRAGQVRELGRMVIPSFGRGDVYVVATGSRHFSGLLKGSFGGLPAMEEFAVLAHCFYGEVHFFFFFFFFLMISAWALKASASDLIWLAA